MLIQKYRTLEAIPYPPMLSGKIIRESLNAMTYHAILLAFGEMSHPQKRIRDYNDKWTIICNFMVHSAPAGGPWFDDLRRFKGHVTSLQWADHVTKQNVDGGRLMRSRSRAMVQLCSNQLSLINMTDLQDQW